MPNNIPPLGTKEYLVALRDTCNSILSNQRESLLCKEAIWSRDQDDGQWATIRIVSLAAAPWERNAYDGVTLRYELDHAGFKDVEVRTEW